MTSTSTPANARCVVGPVTSPSSNSRTPSISRMTFDITATPAQVGEG